MEVRPHRIIKRKKTKEIKVGKLTVGGNSKISVQSMTNTLTTDIKATINQINLLEEAGADIVRVSCPDENSTKASVYFHPAGMRWPKHCCLFFSEKSHSFRDSDKVQRRFRALRDCTIESKSVAGGA